jgi:small conductance mechanosensitive channel
MPSFWQHVLVASAVIAVSSGVAKLVDWRISRRELPPESITRYRVLRRSVFSAIVFVGVLSALLVIPQVRAIAGGVLASSAVIGLVIGFASQRTIGNFVAGILIAFTQPLRLGDEVAVSGGAGVVEEIGLTYTWIRTADNDRLVVPNEKLASDTIRNSTIRSHDSLVEVTVPVSLTADVRAVADALAVGGDEVYVSELTDKATLTVRRWAPGAVTTGRAESELRLDVLDRLRAAGVLGT